MLEATESYRRTAYIVGYVFSTVSLPPLQELWYVSWSRLPYFRSPYKLKLVMHSKKLHFVISQPT